MGLFLLLPLFLIRFGLLSMLNRTALVRAAHFPPMVHQERIAHWIYQISNGAIILLIPFLDVTLTPPSLFYSGILVYALGNVLLAVSVFYFASPSENGMNRDGIYRLSRNPMYVAYFFLFLGCALLTQSRLLLVLVLVFQLSAHWIIRAEERWCIQQFGDAYLQYMKQVRRYL